MSRGVLPQIDAHVALFAEGRNCTSLFAGLGVMTWISTSFDSRKYRYVWLELEDRNISYATNVTIGDDTQVFSFIDQGPGKYLR